MQTLNSLMNCSVVSSVYSSSSWLSPDSHCEIEIENRMRMSCYSDEICASPSPALFAHLIFSSEDSGFCSERSWKRTRKKNFALFFSFFSVLVETRLIEYQTSLNYRYPFHCRMVVHLK